MNKLLKFIIKLTIIVFVILLIILGVVTGIVYYYQDSMIFNESKFPPGAKYEVPSNYETILFTTSEGYKYRCWYATTEKHEESPTLYYVIGNGAFKEEYISTINFYNYNIGVNVFICSNRGSGDYEGHPSEELLYKDAELFFKYITKRTGKNPLFIHGRSMGGAVALETALKYKEHFNGIVLENTFLSIPKVARELHPFLAYFLIGFVYLIKTKMSNELKIQKFDKPTLFLISEKDKVVNPRHMHTLYELSASKNKHKFVNPNGSHHSVESGMEREFIKTYKDFVTKYSEDRNVEEINKAEKRENEITQELLERLNDKKHNTTFRSNN